jgi:hypothetical protein
MANEFCCLFVDRWEKVKKHNATKMVVREYQHKPSRD